MDTTLNMLTTLSIKNSTFYGSNDPFNREHTQLCLLYSVPATGNESCTPTAVRVLVSSARSNNVPKAFLQLGISGHVHIFLRIDKMRPHLGMPESSFMGQMLAQNGELIKQNQ